MQIRVDWLVSQLKIIGGAETFIKLTAPRLRNLGWDLRIVTFTEGGAIAEELRNAGIPLIELTVKNKFDLSIIRSLISLWAKDRPRIVHTHLYHAGIIGRLCAYSLNIHPVIVHQHGPEFSRTRLRSFMDRISSRLVTKYIVTCNAVLQVLYTRERIPINKIEIIYNGMDFPAETKKSLPSNWPVPPNSLSICCVGRLTEAKGQHYLLDALSKLIVKYPNLYTVFLGEGPEKNNLIDMANQYNLSSKVSFVGHINNLKDWLPFFDIFVLPSEWEGISMAILEAMTYALPIITTSTGGNPEIILDGVNGLLTTPKDTDTLTSALESLITDPDQRRRIGEAGRARVMDEFDINKTIRRLDRLYKDLLLQ